MKLLLIGLGNVGMIYKYTRHNMGFLIVDHLAVQQKITFQVDHLASLAFCSYKEHAVYIIKPTTYMNNSGKAVNHWLHTLHIPIQQSLTIVDDISLPLGSMRLRAQGRDGGHNGLKSIAACLQSNGYPRLRVGIGHSFSKGGLSDFVLGNFTSQECATLPFLLNQACEIILTWCGIGIAQAMSRCNSMKNIPSTP